MRNAGEVKSVNFFTGMRRTKLYGKGVNKRLPKGLNWEHIEKLPRQEGRSVVKGTSKRVVVVKSPDPRFFEQAIFILREDLRGKGTGDYSGVLREAQRVADDYVKNFVSDRKHIISRLPPAAFAGAGAVLGALVSMAFIFVI